MDRSVLSPATEGRAWFCLRSQVKHEQVAASHLERMGDIEVFNPRIRFARSTRRGPVWVIESLFPNYLFARFDWRTSLNRVHFAPGVNGIVHFGSQWPIIADETIAELRKLAGNGELQDTERPFVVGDNVRICGGPLHGLEAVITGVMPGQQRVAVLLDFLGRQSMVNVATNSVTRVMPGR